MKSKYVLLFAFTLFSIGWLTRLQWEAEVPKMKSYEKLTTLKKYKPRKEVDFIDVIGIGVYTWHNILGGNIHFKDDHIPVEHLNIYGVDYR